MIRDKLIPILEQKYAAQGVRFGSPPDPIAVFPAKHPRVGEITIWDDGHEATIEIGHITHNHIFPLEKELSQDEVDSKVTEEVLEFLEDMFADRYVFWIAHDHNCAGLEQLLYKGQPFQAWQGRDYFVWSGPINLGSAS